MENLTIDQLDYDTYTEVRSILENPSTMNSFLEVLPPDCSRESILNAMEREKYKYNGTPAKFLLQFLGSKMYRVSDLIQWFEAIKLEKALVHLKSPEGLSIQIHPVESVTLKEGGKLSLKCSATSYPPPDYQWFKAEEELLMEVQPELCIKNVSVDNGGIYYCLVTRWNEEEHNYEYLYSKPSYVKIIPSDLDDVASISQDSQSSFPADISEEYMVENIPTHGSSAVFKKYEIRQHQSEIRLPLTDFDYTDQTQANPKQDLITICKHPFVDGKVPQGMAVCLVCEAISSYPVNYQWFKNRRPMPGENSNRLIILNTYPDPETGNTKWEFQCEVSNTYDRALSQNVVVELDDIKDTTPFTACDKVAFMVANDTYDELEPLLKPPHDVIDVAKMLSSLGFKIFSFRNLTLTEMRNAFFVFCRMLKPGSYALFFFSGHGFDAHGQTYLQTVDSSINHHKEESVCSEYILQCLQETKPAMVILLIDACRKLQPNMDDDILLQNVLPLGTIFQAKMKKNTIYGYSTGFLSGSYESDNEENSVFVKHLKKCLLKDKSVQEILMMVQSECAKDPLVKELQNPTIKSTLAQPRKLSDPVQDSSPCNPLYSILQWCDINRDAIFSHTFALGGVNAEIIVEAHHHMKVFCNGIDISVYLLMESNTNLRALMDIEINLFFKSEILKVEPKEGIAIKNINLQVGKRNFLFKKEVLNVQKITGTKEHREEIVMELRYCSKNDTRSINFTTELSVIPKLQLSSNRLLRYNIEAPRKYPMVPNSFK